MRVRNIMALWAAIIPLVFSACSDAQEQPLDGGEEQPTTYSFTAVLDDIRSRISYEETNEVDLKMVWDEGDVIRLYPDKSMNDSHEYYEFVANTGIGTSHTVFVYQGYINNWENWSGKAIYCFPDEENLNLDPDLSHDRFQAFSRKAYIQKANGDTGHLKYAEHTVDKDGNEQYTEYWAHILDGVNLKHDTKWEFNHFHTVIYKVMLQGFLSDIPQGSKLIMSGAAWPNGEETVLTLGTAGEKEPFLKVGDFNIFGHYDADHPENNKVLTAYIPRSVPVAGGTDGSIKATEKLKFELLLYDENDGKVWIDLDPADPEEHRTSVPEGEYFKNITWGDEYIWEVRASKGIKYNAGDYVVGDLSDPSEKYSVPRVALDMGLPFKIATHYVGAEKPDDYGLLYMFGYPSPGFEPVDGSTRQYDGRKFPTEWKAGDPERDVATVNWGSDWRMMKGDELKDFLQYLVWLDKDDKPMKQAPPSPFWDEFGIATSNKWYLGTAAGAVEPENENIKRECNDILGIMVGTKVNDRRLFLPFAGNVAKDGARSHYKSSTPGACIMSVDINSYNRQSGIDHYTYALMARTDKGVYYNPLYNRGGESDGAKLRAQSVLPVKEARVIKGE